LAGESQRGDRSGPAAASHFLEAGTELAMLTYFGTTDTGRRRPLNEDAVYAADGLFVVCDGMGGHKAGEVASRLAIDSITAFIRRSGDDPEITWPYGFDPHVSFSANRVRTAIKIGNRVVYRKAVTADEYTGMGTTVVVALIPPGAAQMTYASVGDSRIYLIRDGAMVQLTRDDSWANLPVDETVPGANLRNVLTKAVGAQDDVEFDISNLPLSAGDIVLLCSDGLTNMIPDDQILSIVTEQADLERAGLRLVDAANAQGGRDNVSIVLVRYQP
jgi:protein phosphatase